MSGLTGGIKSVSSIHGVSLTIINVEGYRGNGLVSELILNSRWKCLFVLSNIVFYAVSGSQTHF